MSRDRFTVLAPGRVNLIGEHVDYCELPVLPMAIQFGIRLTARARRDARVEVRSATMPGPRRFDIGTDIPPLPRGDWGNYVQAAAQALSREVGSLTGMDAHVEGDLSVAVGLSSSSALVVASALALLRANGRTMDPLALASLLAQGEHYVGTAGGGMDQAIIVGARSGHAAEIAFSPLRLRHVPLPPAWAIVVASSMQHAEKSGAVQVEYNARGEDSRAARAAVAARLGVAGASYPALLASFTIPQLLDAAQALEPRLLRRFRHVVTEGDRVPRAVRALEVGDLPAFGALLDASHASLAQDYDVSTPALDELAVIARSAGAAGARLTGAGFGGSIVAVASSGNAAQVMAALQREYYAPRGVIPQPTQLFIARPSAGAGETTV
jgi:galactokinase